MRWKFRSAGRLAVIIVPWVLLAAQALWGQGWLLNPKMRIEQAAVELDVPPEYQLELMMLRMLFSEHTINQRMASDLAEDISRLGVPKERAIQITNSMVDKAETGVAGMPDVHLTDLESRIVQAAASHMMTSGWMKDMWAGLEVPQGVLFFTVENTGHKAASEVLVKVQADGTPLNARIDSEATYERSDDSNMISLRFQRFPPGAKVRGTVWYASAPIVKYERNVISVAHESGTLRTEVKPKDFLVMQN